MQVILFLVFFILLVIACASVFLFNKKKSMKGFMASIAAAVIALFLLILIPGGFYQVETGEAALIKEFGSAKSVETPGLKWRLWFKDQVEIYDLKVQTIDEVVPAYSQDAQTMKADLTVQFKIQQDKIIEINTTFGNIDALKSRLQSVATEKTKVVLASSSAMKIIENRDQLSSTVENEIKSAVGQYYVDITMVTVNNIDFNDAFESAVEQKMIAEQEQLKAEYDKQKAIIKAQEELEVAKLEAEAELAKATASAEAIKVTANAQAESIKIKSVEIARMLGFEIDANGNIIMTGHTTEEIKVISDYLKYIEYLENWDGKLPTVVGDSSTVVIPTPTV